MKIIYQAIQPSDSYTLGLKLELLPSLSSLSSFLLLDIFISWILILFNNNKIKYFDIPRYGCICLFLVIISVFIMSIFSFFLNLIYIFLSFPYINMYNEDITVLAKNSISPSFLFVMREFYQAMKSLLKQNGYVCLLFCVLFYVGAEIVVGGWISSLVIEYLYILLF